MNNKYQVFLRDDSYQTKSGTKVKKIKEKAKMIEE